MKTRILRKGLWGALLALIALPSCSKDETSSGDELEKVKQANIILRINNLTKSTGVAHNNQSNDNQINNLAVFVFKNDAAKTLETYKYFVISNQELLNNINFQSTTGLKNIYVVANSHDSTQWTGIVNESDFLLKEANLKNEGLKDFTMSGKYSNASISQSNTINMTLKRVVAKVVVNSIKTDFANTPYQGISLTSVKIYLTNVPKIRPFIEGGTTTNPFFINSGSLQPSSFSDCKISGLVYDEIAGSITDTPYSEKHHLYTYENTISQESSGQKFTRLVIEAMLNGVKYYYPVNINRDGYGGTTNNGIERNTVYNISVIIKRPGSSSPEMLVEKGTVITSITIADWDNQNMGEVEF